MSSGLSASGDTDGNIVTIDEFKCNRLYQTTEPLVPLLIRLEELLRFTKKVSSIQVDLSGSCSSGKMFAKLGYTSETLPDQNNCRWSKTLLVVEEKARQAEASKEKARQAEASTSEAEASTSAPALPSQAQRRRRGSVSQASAPALPSQASNAAVASPASTAVVASTSAPRRGGSETAAVASTSAPRRGVFDTARLEPKPDGASPNCYRPISPEVVHITHRYINSASNAEFELDPSHRGWKCIGIFGGCQFWLSPTLDAVMVITVIKLNMLILIFIYTSL